MASKVQVDEKKAVKARKDFYDNAVRKHETMVKRLKFVSEFPNTAVFKLLFNFFLLSFVRDPYLHPRLLVPLLELRLAPLLSIDYSNILPKPTEQFIQ